MRGDLSPSMREREAVYLPTLAWLLTESHASRLPRRRHLPGSRMQPPTPDALREAIRILLFSITQENPDIHV